MTRADDERVAEHDSRRSDGGDSTRRLQVADCDLGGIAEALDDNSLMIEWWFDPATGELEPATESMDRDEREALVEDYEERGMLYVHSEGSGDAYRDMSRFAYFVGDPAVKARLEQALEGRGAFRRFRHELDRLPELYGQRWLRYSDLRAEERAIDWLRLQNVVDEADAEREAHERERDAVAILDEIEALGGMRIETDEVPERWPDVLAALDGGTPVTLLRGGEMFAVIEPET